MENGQEEVDEESGQGKEEAEGWKAGMRDRVKECGSDAHSRESAATLTPSVPAPAPAPAPAPTPTPALSEMRGACGLSGSACCGVSWLTSAAMESALQAALREEMEAEECDTSDGDASMEGNSDDGDASMAGNSVGALESGEGGDCDGGSADACEQGEG